MRPLAALLIGVVIGILVIPMGAYLYLRFGYAPVATSARPFPFEKTITHMALNARVSKEAPKDAALNVTDANLIAGAKIYRTTCSVCHGLIDQPKTATAQGMFPPPPQLMHGKGVSDDPVGETYWKVENGIRLTGMPAYKGSLTEDDIWRVSLTLAHADKLPADAVQILKQPLPAN